MSVGAWTGLADKNLYAVGGRHEHHVEGPVLALARNRKPREKQHLNEREHRNEARHDRVAGDAVLVPAGAVAHFDGESRAVRRVDFGRDRADVAVRDARGRGVARIGDDHHLALAREVVRKGDAHERLARVDAALKVGERNGVSLEVEEPRAGDAAHDLGRRARMRFVQEHPRHALEIEGRAVAEENGLQEDGGDEHHPGALVAEGHDEFLDDDGENAVEGRENVPPEGLQHAESSFFSGGRFLRARTASTMKSPLQQHRMATLRQRIGPSPARKHCLKASTA